MNVITVERARAEGLTARQVAYAAIWNDAAAKMAKRRNAHGDVKRFQAQATALKTVARALVA